MKSWIYQRSKTELITELSRLGLDTDGGIDLLRHHLRKYIEAHSTSTCQTPPPVEMSTETGTTEALPDTAKVMNQIRKWGCHFEGKDPLAYLERIEELRRGYGFTGD